MIEWHWTALAAYTFVVWLVIRLWDQATERQEEEKKRREEIRNARCEQCGSDRPHKISGHWICTDCYGKDTTTESFSERRKRLGPLPPLPPCVACGDERSIPAQVFPGGPTVRLCKRCKTLFEVGKQQQQAD